MTACVIMHNMIIKNDRVKDVDHTHYELMGRRRFIIKADILVVFVWYILFVNLFSLFDGAFGGRIILASEHAA